MSDPPEWLDDEDDVLWFGEPIRDRRTTVLAYVIFTVGWGAISFAVLPRITSVRTPSTSYFWVTLYVFQYFVLMGLIKISFLRVYDREFAVTEEGVYARGGTWSPVTLSSQDYFGSSQIQHVPFDELATAAERTVRYGFRTHDGVLFVADSGDELFFDNIADIEAVLGIVERHRTRSE